MLKHFSLPCVNVLDRDTNNHFLFIFKWHFRRREIIIYLSLRSLRILKLMLLVFMDTGYYGLGKSSQNIQWNDAKNFYHTFDKPYDE